MTKFPPTWQPVLVSPHVGYKLSLSMLYSAQSLEIGSLDGVAVPASPLTSDSLGSSPTWVIMWIGFSGPT